MHKIISTTDNKNLGSIINVNAKEIILGDFTMIPSKKEVRGDEVVLSNSNYIINTVKIK